MTAVPRIRILTLLTAMLVFAVATLYANPGPTGSSASAAGVDTGGLGVPGIPEITDVVCVRQCVSTRKATPGAIVRLNGRNLDRVRKVIFPGRQRAIRVSAERARFSSVRVTVPPRADDGRPAALTASGERLSAPRVLEILPVTSIPTEVFPVRGPHNFGSSGARFGAGRTGYSHQGQDVMAPCGTRLVSIRRSRVLFNQYHGAAGWYVVLKNLGTNTQFAYMHLIRQSKLRVGQVVGAGQTVGFVGQTGRAYGCHLHFEFWIGPWQMGGRPIDPLPYLRSL